MNVLGNIVSFRKTRFFLLLALLAFSNIAGAATYYWYGASNGNWGTSANWFLGTGGTGGAGAVPLAGDNVIFDNNSLSCAIDVNAVCNNLTVTAGFTNTINQNNGKTLSISGTSAWSGGTFSGGNKNITNTGAFTVSGMAFTSTSGTLILKSSFTLSSGTFTHNSGTVTFDNHPLGGTFSITGTPTFYDLTVIGYYGTFTVNNSIVVADNLTLDATNGSLTAAIGTVAGITITVNATTTLQGSSLLLLNTGTIIANGNFTDNNTSTGATYGTATIKFTGAGTQTFSSTGTAGQGELPNIIINATGTINLSGTISVGHNWTYTSGTISPGASTIYLDETTNAITVSGVHTLNNVTINQVYATTTISNNLTVNNFTINATQYGTLAVSSNLTINGTLSLTGTSYIIFSTGNIFANGNITITNTGIYTTGNGPATLNITGSGNQTISNTAGTVGQGCLPSIVINSTGGTVSLSGLISTQNWTYTAGTVSAGSSTVDIYGPYANSGVGYYGPFTLTSNGMSFYNLSIDAGQVTLGNALTVTNNLSINSATLAPITFIASGNAMTVGGNFTNNANFTSNSNTLTLNGAGAQTYTQAANGGWPNTAGGNLYNLTVTNSSVTTLASIMTVTNNLTISGTATLASDVYNITGNAAGTFTMGAGTSLTLGNTGSATATIFPSAFTAAHTTLNVTSTVTYQANGAQTVSVTPTYGNLVISTGAAASTKTLPGTPLTIAGNLTTNASATLSTTTRTVTLTGNFINNGTFSASTGTFNISGDFTNNSTFTPGTGTTIFKGSIAQAIGGSTSTTFYNFTLNNSSGMTTGVTQNINTNVSNILTLTAGAYNLNGFTLSLSTTLTGGSATAYVVSENTSMTSIFQWNNISMSVASFVFPFGATIGGTNYYLPFTFNISSAALSLGNVAAATYDVGSNNTPFAPGVTNLIGASTGCYGGIDESVQAIVDRWWYINAPSNPTANITFTYAGPEAATLTGIPGCGSTLDAYQWNTSLAYWNPRVGGGTAAITAAGSTGSLSSASQATFPASEWVAGLFAAALPIKLVYFDAKVNDEGNVNCTWEAATQSNNRLFTVEKSIDGVNFDSAGTLPGAGTTSQLIDYSLLDEHPYTGTSYYRLKQTDIDGASTVSAIVPVNISPKAGMTIFPNPAKATMLLNYITKAASTLNVQITDLTGRVISTNDYNLQNGGNTFSINVSNLAQGTYLLQAFDGVKTTTSKFIKQ